MNAVSASGHAGSFVHTGLVNIAPFTHLICPPNAFCCSAGLLRKSLAAISA